MPGTGWYETELLRSGITPHVSTLCLPDIIIHIVKSRRPPPSLYCKQLRSGGGEGLEIRFGHVEQIIYSSLDAGASGQLVTVNQPISMVYETTMW